MLSAWGVALGLPVGSYSRPRLVGDMQASCLNVQRAATARPARIILMSKRKFPWYVFFSCVCHRWTIDAELDSAFWGWLSHRVVSTQPCRHSLHSDSARQDDITILRTLANMLPELPFYTVFYTVPFVRFLSLFMG